MHDFHATKVHSSTNSEDLLYKAVPTTTKARNMYDSQE